MAAAQPMPDTIKAALLRDRHRLRGCGGHCSRREGTTDPPRPAGSMTDCSRSRSSVVKPDGDNLPRPDFNQDLPILEYRHEIAELIRDHQVVIVQGETGSGKSTQLPKICLEAGFGISGLIGHTQPRDRRRGIATRLAEELGKPLGQEVGFKIRFTDRTEPQTYIKVMTDGILLAETQGDRYLDQYEVIILDEGDRALVEYRLPLGVPAASASATPRIATDRDLRHDRRGAIQQPFRLA